MIVNMLVMANENIIGNFIKKWKQLLESRKDIDKLGSEIDSVLRDLCNESKIGTEVELIGLMLRSFARLSGRIMLESVDWFPLLDLTHALVALKSIQLIDETVDRVIPPLMYMTYRLVHTTGCHKSIKYAEEVMSDLGQTFSESSCQFNEEYVTVMQDTNNVDSDWLVQSTFSLTTLLCEIISNLLDKLQNDCNMINSQEEIVSAGSESYLFSQEMFLNAHTCVGAIFQENGSQLLDSASNSNDHMHSQNIFSKIKKSIERVLLQEKGSQEVAETSNPIEQCVSNNSSAEEQENGHATLDVSTPTDIPPQTSTSRGTTTLPNGSIKPEKCECVTPFKSQPSTSKENMLSLETASYTEHSILEKSDPVARQSTVVRHHTQKVRRKGLFDFPSHSSTSGDSDYPVDSQLSDTDLLNNNVEDNTKTRQFSGRSDTSHISICGQTKRVHWTWKEELQLFSAVVEYGGQTSNMWAYLARSGKFERTNVQLKDKWRTIKQQKRIPALQKAYWKIKNKNKL